jgi:hypothetical protein
VGPLTRLDVGSVHRSGSGVVGVAEENWRRVSFSIRVTSKPSTREP